MAEQWKPVDGYENSYEVSSLGRMRRASKSKRSEAGQILYCSLCNYGYPIITLMESGKKRVNRRVHILVARAFIGDRPPGKEINHIDGNKANAAVSNLEYVSHAENMAHAKKMGLRKVGRTAKLNEKQVALMKGLSVHGGVSAEVIAKVFEMSPRQVRDIVSNRAWVNVKPEQPVSVKYVKSFEER